MIEPKLRMKQLIALVITIVMLFTACVWCVTSGEFHMSVSTFSKHYLVKVSIRGL